MLQKGIFSYPPMLCHVPYVTHLTAIMVRFEWAALLASLAFVVSDAFVSPHTRCAPVSAPVRQQCRLTTAPTRARFLTARRATEEDSPAPSTASSDDPTPAAAVPEEVSYYSGLLGGQPGNDGEQATTKVDYPINLPSYFLLALATVLSIAFTGSIFEVTGGKPELGYIPTYIIGTLSLPSFVFLFYAAMKKGQAEVDEDDAKYGRGPW